MKNLELLGGEQPLNRLMGCPEVEVLKRAILHFASPALTLAHLPRTQPARRAVTASRQGPDNPFIVTIMNHKTRPNG